MKYFRILVVLLAGASRVSAAPFRFCELSAADIARINAIIDQTDDPAQLEGILEDCRLKRDDDNFELLLKMIEHNRPESFAFLYSRFDFHSDANLQEMIASNNWDATARDKTMLLNMAYLNHSIGICDFMLGRDDFKPAYGIQIWPIPEPWTLQEIKDLISHHPRRAKLFVAQLYSPREGALEVEETLMQIEVNLHCASVNKDIASNKRFSPTTMLNDLIQSNYSGSDQDFATVFDRLIAAGAAVDEKMRSDFAQMHPEHEMAEHTLFYSFNEDIKEPGCD